MTFQPEADKHEIRCPLNFTVQPKRPVEHSCGFAACHPATCEMLHRQGFEIKRCDQGQSK